MLHRNSIIAEGIPTADHPCLGRNLFKITSRNLHGSDTILTGYSTHLSLRTHVAGILIEAHTGCAAVLVQHLFPEAASSRVVFGDHLWGPEREHATTLDIDENVCLSICLSVYLSFYL